MSFIKTTSAAEATGDVRTMYEKQQGDWGFVPDYVKVFCHRPEVMTHWSRLLDEIKRPLSARRLEMVTFAAAHELRHTACSLAHGGELAKLIGDEAVMAIARGEPCERVTEAEMAMIAFARRVARDASRITREEVAALRDEHGFSDAEIFDIAAVAASRSFFTKLLDALGVEPDQPFMKMNEPLRDTLTVGRPINQAPPERLG